MLDTINQFGHELLRETNRLVVGFVRIDAYFLYILAHQVAQRAQRQCEILIDALTDLGALDILAQGDPQLAQIVDILSQCFAGLAFGIGAHDVTDAAIGRERDEHFLEPRAFGFVLDAHRYAKHFAVRQ